jgi:hypothetical protein
MNDTVIQEFTEKEAIAKKQVKVSWAKLEALRQNYSDQSDSGQVMGACWGLVGP